MRSKLRAADLVLLPWPPGKRSATELVLSFLSKMLNWMSFVPPGFSEAITGPSFGFNER